MNLKELFAKAENGTLTYEQLMTLSNEQKAKFVDLSEGNYVAKQKYIDELTAKEQQITELNGRISQRDTDLTNLQTKLQEATNDTSKLAEVSSQLEQLQNQYSTDIESYKERLSNQAYEFAVKDFASTKKFSSKASKRDFINSMLSKKLQMEGDKILGADDFLASYSKDNEDAFIIETPEIKNEPKPKFVDKTSGNANPDENPFKFAFTGVRLREENN